MQFILGGGDDHALLATFPDVAAVPEGWAVIGAVAEGEGVTVDGAPYDGPDRLDALLSCSSAQSCHCSAVASAGTCRRHRHRGDNRPTPRHAKGPDRERSGPRARAEVSG